MALKTISSRLPKLPKFELPEKYKGTIVERWANYWKGLARDYQEVAVDSVKSIRGNPKRSAVYGSIGGFLYGCAKTAPDERTFLEQFKVCQQNVSLVTLKEQNPTAVEYLKLLERRKNDDTLRITSIGFFSLLWIDDNASQLSTFDAKCEYLQPELLSFHERVVDIGFWNNWWNLDRKMKDYDVNF